MANTKEMTREERKKAKREARKKLKAIQANLSPKDRKAILKAEEPIGVKHFLAMKAKADKEKSAAE